MTHHVQNTTSLCWQIPRNMVGQKIWVWYCRVTIISCGLGSLGLKTFFLSSLQNPGNPFCSGFPIAWFFLVMVSRIYIRSTGGNNMSCLVGTPSTGLGFRAWFCLSNLEFFELFNDPPKLVTGCARHPGRHTAAWIRWACADSTQLFDVGRDTLGLGRELRVLGMPGLGFVASNMHPQNQNIQNPHQFHVVFLENRNIIPWKYRYPLHHYHRHPLHHILSTSHSLWPSVWSQWACYTWTKVPGGANVETLKPHTNKNGPN